MSLGGGIYLTDDSTVIVDLSSLDIDNSGDRDELSARYKTVAPYFDDKYVNIEASISYIDEAKDTSFGIDGRADYYVNKTTSVGALIGAIFGDDESATVGVGAKHFFSAQIAAYVDLAFEKIDDAEDSLTFGFGAMGRF